MHASPLLYYDQFGLFSENTSFSYFGYHGLYDDSASLPLHDYKMASHFSNALGDIGNSLSNTFNNTRFQGSIQAMGGLAEAGFGATMSLLPHWFAHHGTWPRSFFHWNEHCNQIAITGIPKFTVTTSGTLQLTGMTSQTAGLIDNGLSIVGSLTGASNFCFAGTTSRQFITTKLEYPAKIGMNFNSDLLSLSGKVIDRNGLSKAGRALQKHCNRPKSIFPKMNGSSHKFNQVGQHHLDSILSDPTRKINIWKHRNLGNVVDIQTSSNGGARFSQNGDFIGFLEP